MNKLIFIIILFFSICINAYNIPESIDPEYFVDNISNDFNDYSLINFIKSDNYILISGGCYNVELLSINQLIKTYINILNTKWFFDFNYYSIDNMDEQFIFLGYGLSYRINNYIDIGFLANPTFEKRNSDISIVIRIKGYDTKNEFILTAENFDNNYANKNNKYTSPMLYMSPKVFPGEYMVFPFNYLFSSTGNIDDFEFMGIIYNKLPRKSEYYNDNYEYMYETDSMGLYSKLSGINTYIFNAFTVKSGSGISARYLENITDTVYELDKSYKVESYISIEHNSGLGVLLKYAYMDRKVMNRSDTIYQLKSNEIYAGVSYIKNKWTIELGEIINPYTVHTDSIYSFNETRLLLQIKYSFNNKTHIIVKKGFETDYTDIENGGKFFFYDKMYIHFESEFDNF